METNTREGNENRKGLVEGDLVIFLESHGGVNGKPDIKTTSYIFSEISQVSFNGQEVRLHEPPREQTDNPNHLREGSTLGFVEDSALVLPAKIDNTLFKPADKGVLEKNQNVRVRIGIKGGRTYVVNGVFFGKLPDQDMYVIDVRNENGLEGRILVLPENVCMARDLEVDREDQILSNETIDLMDKLWRETHSTESFPGHYDYTEAMRIARDWPRVAKGYLDLMRKFKDFDSSLSLISGAPYYAKVLRPIFDEYPDLLPIYARFAQSLPKDGLTMSQDQRLGSSRISTVCDVEAIQKHLENVKQIEAALNNILGDKESMLIATPFGGLAEVYLERMRFSKEERDGIYLLIRSPSGDFTTISRKIHVTGIISSANDSNQLAEIGYLLRNNYEIDEKSFLGALIKYPPLSEELNKALEESGARDGNQYGNFEKHVFRER
jgi:hypothetical protein